VLSGTGIVAAMDADEQGRKLAEIVRGASVSNGHPPAVSHTLATRVNLEKRPMNLTIDLSEQNAAALESQARAARMPADRYLADIVARALERQHRQDAENLGKHLDYMAAQIAPDTTTEEMEAALQEALTQVRPHRSWRL